MVFSASAVTAREQFGHASVFILRQLVWLALGLGGMFWLMNVDYHKLRQPVVVCSVLCAVLMLLVAVFFISKSHATHRWIHLGPIHIQPSELAKLRDSVPRLVSGNAAEGAGQVGIQCP